MEGGIVFRRKLSFFSLGEKWLGNLVIDYIIIGVWLVFFLFYWVVKRVKLDNACEYVWIIIK